MESKNKPGRGKELRLENSLHHRQDLRLFTMLAAPESDFLELVRRLESDPLFRKLAARAGGRQVISRIRRGAHYSWDYNLGDARLLSAPDCAYIGGELLSARPEALKLARRLGAADFERYFLDENGAAPEEIRRATGLKPAEVSRIRDFVDAFLSAHENLPAPACRSSASGWWPWSSGPAAASSCLTSTRPTPGGATKWTAKRWSA